MKMIEKVICLCVFVVPLPEYTSFICFLYLFRFLSEMASIAAAGLTFPEALHLVGNGYHVAIIRPLGHSVGTQIRRMPMQILCNQHCPVQ